MRAAEIPQLRGAVTAAGGQTMLSGTRKVDLLLFFSYGRYSIQHKVGLFCFGKADVKSTYLIWFRYGCGILKDLFMMLSSGSCAGQSPGTGPSSPHIMAAVSGPTGWQQRGRFPSRWELHMWIFFTTDRAKGANTEEGTSFAADNPFFSNLHSLLTNKSHLNHNFSSMGQLIADQDSFMHQS